MRADPFSFPAGTKISTEAGFKNIEDVIVGDMVYSLNMETYDVELAQVTKTYKRISPIVYDLLLNDESSIRVTDDHPFFIRNKGWVVASQLRVGDFLRRSDGTVLQLMDVREKQSTTEVYNLGVNGYHNYFVGESEVLVYSKK